MEEGSLWPKNCTKELWKKPSKLCGDRYQTFYGMYSSKRSRLYHIINYATKEDSNTCLFQMDFAENYSTKYQDEIQSAHWHKAQITVYTVMAYHRNQIKSMYVVSDTRDHTKTTVMTKKVVELGVIAFPTAAHFNIWTDGPNNQFKNRFMVRAFLVVLNNLYEGCITCLLYTSPSPRD